MAIIKMRRLRANTPDEGRNICLTWEDRGNPMRDSDGNIIYTDVLGQNGLPLPLYKEFPVSIQIPYNLPATAEERATLITGLKDQALEIAKLQAQKRANDMADKAILRSLITTLNTTVGIDFEGTVEITDSE
jgi:hypothetical protein